MALLPVFALLALVGGLGTLAVLGRRPSRSSEATVVAARRHGLLVASIAPVAGVVTAGLVVAGGDVVAGNGRPGFPGSTGDALALVPLAYALAHTLVHLVGELTWPGPSDRVRRARLVHRRLVDVAPRVLLRLAGGGLVLVVALLGLGAALSAPDGRSTAHGSGDPLQPGSTVHQAGPWPGAFYGRPLAVELVLLVLVGAAALWVVVNRPAVATQDDRVETTLRRVSAHRVLRGVAAMLLVLAGGLLSTEGGALGSVGVLPEGVGLALVLAGGGLALAGVAVLFLPAPRIPQRAPAVPAA